MTEKGLKLLAKEIQTIEYKDSVEKVRKHLFRHNKGSNRKKEREAFYESDAYKEALSEELSNNHLYADCIHLNMNDGSELVKLYLEKEEAYDYAAELPYGSLINNAEKYVLQKQIEEAVFMDIESLIHEAVDAVKEQVTGSICNYLLHEKLEFKIVDSYDWWSQSIYEYIPVSVDNYEFFVEKFIELDEEYLMRLSGYDGDFFSAAVVDEVIRLHPEFPEDIYKVLWDKFDDEFCEAGYAVADSISNKFDEDKVLELVSQNDHLKTELKAVRALKENVLKEIPERMVDLFPETRKITRKFILHVGPTNSGKTYMAIERLKKANNGIYLGPLRLLAYEQYQKLNKEGYPCTLYTGEEHKIIEGARIQSSTVEMANITKDYDVAVIDEAQMLSDPERGWAWTKAILGLKAKEIHICCSSDAEDIIIGLISECNDQYEISRHERQVPLCMDERRFTLDDVQKKDALIVFSRRNVHAVARELQSKGISCSVIYGNLPYDVRQEEARRFIDGETDVVVATDAIGMGMNLPIKRIVFLETSKFDGTQNRTLKPSEFQQIAGRAGRRGMYDKGLWNVLSEKKFVARAINKNIPSIKEISVRFPETLLSIDGKLSNILNQWMKVKLPDGYKRSSLEHELALCTMAEKKTENKLLAYKFVTIPFDESQEILKYIWERAFDSILAGEDLSLTSIRVNSFSENLDLKEAESLYKEYDLAYALFERFGFEDEVEKAQDIKQDISAHISKLLKESKLECRRCKYCGTKLAWNYPYGMCSDCHDKRFGRKFYYDADDDDFDDDFYQ